MAEYSYTGLVSSYECFKITLRILVSEAVFKCATPLNPKTYWPRRPPALCSASSKASGL